MKNAPRTLGFLATALITTLWTATAFAGGYCDDKTPCPTGEVCMAGLCIPEARLCQTDASCTSWQKCDFTCPWLGQSTGGSTGTGSVDAGTAVSVDATMSDGGEAGKQMPAQDAGSGADPMPYPDDARGYSDIEYDVPPPASCPTTTGVCVVEPTKVALQDGCMAFCSAMLACGGSSTTSVDVDGGSTEPQPAPDASAGFAPPYPADAGASSDGGSGVYYNPDAADQLPPDVTTVPTEADLTQCVLFCSVIKLEKVAQPEFSAFEKCVAEFPACDTMKANCADESSAFEAAMSSDWLWSLGFGYFGTATSGNGDPKADSDTAVGPVLSDASSDAIGSGPGQESSKTTVDDSASSGCTAGAASSPNGPLGLVLMALAAVWLRRRQEVRARS